MGHDAVCRVVFAVLGVGEKVRWGQSALRIVESECDQLGLFDSGSCLPLELAVQQVLEVQTNCE